MTSISRFRSTTIAVFAAVGMVAFFGVVGAPHGLAVGPDVSAHIASHNHTAPHEVDAGSGVSSSTATRAHVVATDDVAMAVALKEAESSIPSAAGTFQRQGVRHHAGASPAGAQSAPEAVTWPSHVSAVAYITSTRGEAEPYVGAAVTADATPVVVVQLVGQFAVTISEPPPAGASMPPRLSAMNASSQGGFATGQVMTVVASASSGNVLDTGLVPSSAPVISLPDPHVLYRR